MAVDGTESWTYVKQCTANCPNGIATVTVHDTLRDGTRVAVPMLEFADSAGHVRRTVTWGFDGSKIATEAVNDERGRPSASYWPRYASDAAILGDVGTLPSDAILSSGKATMTSIASPAAGRSMRSTTRRPARRATMTC